MYKEKLEPILNDVESKDVEIAGGSVVGIMLATVNSLIKYISNLTLGKKKYEDVQPEIERILKKGEELKQESLSIIDKDTEVLEEILKGYKIKKEDKQKYLEYCKKGVEFCIHVLEVSFETLKLADRIEKVGNRLLSSDSKISKYYAYASIKSSIVNIEINLNPIEDMEYKASVTNKYTEILENAEMLV